MIELTTFALGTWNIVLLDGPTAPVKREVITPSMRNDMYLEQHGECAYCSKPLTRAPADFDLDHIVPVKHGGPTCRSNLHLLCIRCHRTKSSIERRTGGELYRPADYPSDSVVIRTATGFPRVRPADFPTLKSGVYTLDYGPHTHPRPAVTQSADTRSVKMVVAKASSAPGMSRSPPVGPVVKFPEEKAACIGQKRDKGSRRRRRRKLI